MQNSKKTIFHGGNYILSLPGNLLITSKKGYRKFNVSMLFLFIAFIVFSSCSTTRNQVYFQNLQKDTTLRNIVTPNYELKIQKNDVLGITVVSLSPDVAFYNGAQSSAAPSSGSSSSSSSSSGSGYPVDKDGNISFVKIGTLHVLGMTRKELKDTLEKGLVPYLKDVIVSVTFLNRHVTMLGAVNSQVLPMAGDNMTILDALAASGDVGVKGKIDNILLIRDKENGKEFKRISLKDNSIFYSPYFYLQPNDIVYVEPTRIKTPLTASQLISYITAGISLIILILNTVKL